MKQVINKTQQDLTYDQHLAIIEVAQRLEKAFGRKIFTATVNAQAMNEGEIYGIAFAFDNFS